MRDSLLREMQLRPRIRPQADHTRVDREAGALGIQQFSGKAYPTRNEFIEHLARLMHEETGTLAGIGVDYVQLDGLCHTYACGDDGCERLRAARYEARAVVG